MPMSWCPDLHPIAEPAHGLDDVAAELGAELVDVNLDRVALHFLLPAIQTLLDHAFRAQHSGPLHQGFQHGKLAARKADDLAAGDDGHMSRIEHDAVAGQEGRGASGLPPADGPQARAELVEIEWLAEIVVGAGV